MPRARRSFYGVPYADGAGYLGGTQDNGTLLGGDGDWVAADPDDPQIVYGQKRGRPPLRRHRPRSLRHVERRLHLGGRSGLLARDHRGAWKVKLGS